MRTPRRGPRPGLRSVQNGASTLLGAAALGRLWFTGVASAADVAPPTITIPLLLTPRRV